MTAWTVPSAVLALSVPPRSVNNIVPSGAKAMSQGMVRPEIRVVTTSCGTGVASPTW